MYRLGALGEAVAALAARMDPQEAAHTGTPVWSQCWSNPSRSIVDRLWALGQAVAALAARMDPQEAARTANRLVTVLEKPQQIDSYRLVVLGEAVAALAARMDPQEAARTANRLVTVLEQPQQIDSVSPGGPRRGGSSPGGPDGPAGGGTYCQPFGDGAGESPADR